MQVESLSQPLPWRVYNLFSMGFKQRVLESLLTISATLINSQQYYVFKSEHHLVQDYTTVVS